MNCPISRGRPRLVLFILKCFNELLTYLNVKHVPVEVHEMFKSSAHFDYSQTADEKMSESRLSAVCATNVTGRKKKEKSSPGCCVIVMWALILIGCAHPQFDLPAKWKR